MSYRREASETINEGAWTFWRLFPPILLMVIVLGVVGYGVSWLFRPAAVVDKVTDPDRIIQNYEWFEQTYNDALALDRKVEATSQQIDTFAKGLSADRTQWGRTDKEEYNRLNAVSAGLRSQRESVVADYNAHSKQITRNLWKSPNLPYQLTVEDDRTQEISR